MFVCIYICFVVILFCNCN